MVGRLYQFGAPAALFWAGSFVVARALRDDIDPVALTFFRWLISLLVFAPFVSRAILTQPYPSSS